MRIHHDANIAVETVLECLESTGTPMKTSNRSAVWRVERWVVKQSRGSFIARTVRHTLQYQKHRRHWDAACYLNRRGIHVPRPIAFVEWCFAGLHTRNALISELLEGQRNVEQHLFTMTRQDVGKEKIVAFLEQLARAINQLNQCNAYHADLSGKNIFTRDGEHFSFIDLDAVILQAQYTEERRMRNHVQLYDSFCDQLSDHLLVPFITQLLPEDIDPRIWMPKVRSGQQERRRRIEAIWEKQGKFRPKPEVF